MSDAAKRVMEIANFVCKFGDKNLADHLESFFLPAIFGGGIRRYGSTSYHLKDLEFVHGDFDGETQYVLYGRFVKNLVLRREQVLRGGVLKADKAQLESAPSAIFAIVLNTHRLLFVPETNYAPKVDELANTIKFMVNSFIVAQEKSFRANRRQQKIAGVILKEMSPEDWKVMFPKAEIRATPLASSESLSAFVGRFGRLEKMQVTVLETNHEIDWSELFADVRSSGKDLSSQSTEVLYKSKDGLNTSVAQEHIEEIANQGNHEIDLRGVDHKGDLLKGNNHEMRMQVDFEISKDVNADAENMVKKFLGLIENKIIKVGKVPNNILEKLRKAYNNKSDLTGGQV